MTKKEILATLLDEYKDRKELFYGLSMLADEKGTDIEHYKMYTEAADKEWHTANVIESIANKIFPNVDFYNLYLDTLE